MTPAATSEERITLFGVGDVGPLHEPVDQYASLVKDTIRTGDIRFAQCEKIYSDKGALVLHSNGHYSRVPQHMAAVFDDCGFNVVSVASNHLMDWGPDALLDTMEMFHRKGVQTVGGGRNIKEARKPAIFDIRGVRVGILGYVSVIREGYWAGPDTPGMVPMRAHTYYEAQEYQAGTPPKVITVPFEDDLKALCNDVERTAEEVDVVVLSFHWGVHAIPKIIADYESTVAKAAFDHGASLILGHHQHLPKGIEVIDGKVCFHGLSHFIFSAAEWNNIVPGHTGHEGGTGRYMLMREPNDPAYPRLPFGLSGKRSMIAKAVLSADGPERVSFLPVIIDTELRPEIMRDGDPRFKEWVEYIEWASEYLPHSFAVEDDEIVIS